MFVPQERLTGSRNFVGFSIALPSYSPKSHSVSVSPMNSTAPQATKTLFGVQTIQRSDPCRRQEPGHRCQGRHSTGFRPR